MYCRISRGQGIHFTGEQVCIVPLVGGYRKLENCTPSTHSMIMACVITDKENVCNGSKCSIDTYIYTRSTMGFSECVSSYKHTQDGLGIKYFQSSNTFLCLPLISYRMIKHTLKIVLFKNNYLDQND